MKATTTALRIVIYEGAPAAALDQQNRFEIVRSLLERGYRVTCSQSGHPVGDASSDPLVLLGRFGGNQVLPELNSDNGHHLRRQDIEGLAAAQVVELVEEMRTELSGPKPKPWKPWFPVIDYQRCTNCMQCLSFCLFDVYSVSAAGKITVQNQNNCKTDCPACSRVCPEVAILFPKYKAGPINGDEIDSEDLRREAMKVDISSLLGGDIYAALRDRSAKAKSRFSKERDDDRALKERQRCLAKLQEQLDVPPEVLASLPSLDQIQAKAEAAKARAAEALQRAALGTSAVALDTPANANP